MKNKLITLVFAILTSILALADTTEPDSMYIHFAGANGDSIVAHAIGDIDSIVYYAPAILVSQGIDWSAVNEGETQTNALTDSDGNSYSAVKIGEQIWMAENLNVSVAKVDTTGGTTDNICQINDVFVWDNTDTSYNKLYSWQAALKSCPTGWHLPSNTEWNTLETYLETNHSNTKGTALKSTTGWYSDGNGTDNYNFAALPGGLCNKNGELGDQSYYGYWWSSTPSGSSNAYSRRLSYYDATVYINDYYRNQGYNVRCIKN